MSFQPDELKLMTSKTTKFEDEPSMEKVELSLNSNVKDDLYWILDCLEDAKNVIIEYHDEKPDDKNFADCTKFFAGKTFDVKLQNNGNASGDIDLIKDLSQSSYKICVNDLLKEDIRDNRRMITIILIHQLLHAIHPFRMHDFTNGQKGITRLEHELANRASYHDALINLESLRQSKKMIPCNI
jgi:hypothetical protein